MVERNWLKISDGSREQASRNISIDFLRLLFAMLVVMTHPHGLRPESGNYPFCGGYIGVEFFLIVHHAA